MTTDSLSWRRLVLLIRLGIDPIEYIWKSIKRVLSLVFVKNLDDMKSVISQEMNKFSKRLGYAEGWINKFLKVDAYAKLCG